jgi:zinc protease
MGLAQHLAATGSSKFFKESLEDLAKVQPGEAMELAYKYLTRERAAAVYFEPENDEVPKLVGGGPGGAGKRTAHDVGRDATSAVAELGPDRILQVARSPGLAKAPRFRLANGLEVVAIKHGTAPVAQVRVGLRGGDAMSKPFGLASWAGRFARTKCRDHGDLLPVGGRIFDFTGLASSAFFVDVLAGNLPNGLAVLSDQISCLEVSEEAFLHRGRLLEMRKKFHERVAKLPDFVAAKILAAELFPGHPLGVAAIDPATLEPITYEDASAWVRSHYRPGNAVAVVVGDIDPGETRTLAEKYLSRWPGGGGALAGGFPAAPPPPAARKAFLVDRPKATQAVVRVACRLADATAERLPAFDLIGELARERAWSLREEWGATYGVFGAAIHYPGGTARFTIGGAIENKQAARAVVRLLDLVAELGSERLEEGFFLVKRWDLARAFNNRFSTGDGIAGAVLQAAEHGWPNDVWDRYPERLAATTREAVREALKPCPGREIVTIVGDAATLRPQLADAGLALESR